MLQHRMRKLALFTITAGVLPVFSQTTPPAQTCTTAPTSVTALNLERVITATGTSSTTTPNIPAALRPGLESGALELRQLFSLNPSTNVITITEHAAQPDSGSPTPPNSIQASNTVSVESFTIDKIYASCRPRPSLLITGTIDQNFPVSPVGNLTGVPAAISLGYTTDTPARVNNAVIVYAGIASVFSAAATGTLTFPTAPVTPPGTNVNAPVINVAGGVNQATGQRQLAIDYSGSTSPLNLPITYTVVQTNAEGGTTGVPVAAGLNVLPTGQALITFPAGGRGTYYFRITATDTGGRTSNQIVAITYAGS